MSEYARRNLVCSSHHKCPEGWRSWTGNINGWTTRPFCWDKAGHAGDHWACIDAIDGGDAQTKMTWPNTVGIPAWLIETTLHGLAVIRAHTYEQDQNECQRLDFLLDDLVPFIEAKGGQP